MNTLKETFKRHWKLILIIAVVAFSMGMLLSGNGESPEAAQTADAEAEVWTCSMHPQVRQPEPGKCPICAMDLIPVEEEVDKDIGQRQLKLSASAMALANVQTAVATRQPVSKQVRLYGNIAVDERRFKTITAWIAGRIEKLYVDYTGAAVRKGAPLVDIYSPELFVAQKEYLTAVQSANPLVDLSSIERKFKLWGFSEFDIEKIKSQDEPSEYATISSPISGVVVEKLAIEGEYVKTGSELYKIADLSQVWVYLDAYESDIQFLQSGQEIKFTTAAYPGETFDGTIDFVEPILEGSTRTVKVRATAKNPQNRLKPGLLVNAVILVSYPETTDTNPIVVPVSAPLITGERAVVYTQVQAKDRVFEGRTVTLGPRVGDYYVVADGLSEGERVVTNGNFKIDSEMQILAKPSMMNPKGDMPTMQHQHAAPAAESEPEMDMQPADAHNHAEHEDMPASEPVSEEFLAQLDPVYKDYFDVQDALSKDNLQNAVKAAQRLNETLNSVPDSNAPSAWNFLAKTIRQSSDAISATQNMGIARAEFQKLSNAMIAMAETLGTSKNLIVKQYHCPMAFNDAGADWLSLKDEVENPYFGSDMFSCGWRVKTFGESADGGQE